MTDNGTNGPDRSYTTRSGVVFKLKPPSLAAASKRMTMILKEQPRPPMVYIEDKGREEPNEADPDYVQAVMEFYARERETVYDVMLMTGTHVDYVPDDVMTWDSEDFETYMEALALPVAKNRHERYAQWCKYVATEINEWGEIISQLLRLGSVTEDQVAQMGILFPGVSQRPTAGPDANPGYSPDGDSAPAPTAGGGADVRADGVGAGIEPHPVTVAPNGVLGEGAPGGISPDA